MIRNISDNRLDQIDRRIIDQLQKRKKGCRIGPLVNACAKSEGATRYRLLTLEACGLIKVVRERGVTTYFPKDEDSGHD